MSDDKPRLLGSKGEAEQPSPSPDQNPAGPTQMFRLKVESWLSDLTFDGEDPIAPPTPAPPEDLASSIAPSPSPLAPRPEEAANAAPRAPSIPPPAVPRGIARSIAPPAPAASAVPPIPALASLPAQEEASHDESDAELDEHGAGDARIANRVVLFAAVFVALVAVGGASWVIWEPEIRGLFGM